MSRSRFVSGARSRTSVIVKASEPKITCQCIRVPVLNGHTAAVFVKFRKKPTKEELIDRLVKFLRTSAGVKASERTEAVYPVLEEDNRPQVSLDVDYENGMGISVGRIREDSIYDYKFVGLSTTLSAEPQAAQFSVQSF